MAAMLRRLLLDGEWKQVDLIWAYVAFMLGLMLGVVLGIWG